MQAGSSYRLLRREEAEWVFHCSRMDWSAGMEWRQLGLAVWVERFGVLQMALEQEELGVPFCGLPLGLGVSYWD